MIEPTTKLELRVQAYIERLGTIIETHEKMLNADTCESEKRWREGFLMGLETAKQNLADIFQLNQ